MALSDGSVMTRSVWAFNLESEFKNIRSAIAFYPFIAMDTEFPGIIFRSHHSQKPESNYVAMKCNVERMHLIQVGLTLSDRHGNLPNMGTSNQFIWEFNFREFDVTRDAQSPDSIAFLRSQGIDFERNRMCGVSIVRFVELMMFAGLVCNNHIQWVSFHGVYDFAYMVKSLSQRFLSKQPFLPADLPEFLHLVKFFFGEKIYDVKHLIKFCPNLYGGLEQVCQSLQLNNDFRRSHQAGSNSLVTLHAFNKIKNVYFDEAKGCDITKYAGFLYTLA